MTQQDVLDRYDGALLPVFGRPQLVLTGGKGCTVTDADGQQYLDLMGGIAVNALGHGHPALVDAVHRASGLLHVSNFFTTPAQVDLAERLLQLSGAPAGSAVFFANSGAEANEAALKLTRRTGRGTVIAAEQGFHGRTTGALALTHNEAYRLPFGPLFGEVVFVPYNDVQALRDTVGRIGQDLAAIFLEPIQGEGGVTPATTAYLCAARELATSVGALLILDEVQTGVARTGAWFAHLESGISPDAMTLAKGLGGGVPIGALLTFGAAVTHLLTTGQHGSTFGGNPLACAAGLAVLQAIEDEGLRANARDRGEQIAAFSAPGVVQVRGRGLLRALELDAPIAAAVAAAARKAGFLVNAVRPSTIRLAPPLIITEDEIGSFLDTVPALIATAHDDAKVVSS